MYDPSAPPKDDFSDVEHIKYNSNFLRGTLEEGMADRITGAVASDDTQLTKFHGTYQQDDRDLRKERRKQKLEPLYSFMIRVRVPSGTCTADQWLKMDELSHSHANGTLKLTTRQAFQFHGVFKDKLKGTMQGIADGLMDSIAACGDVNRNVMATAVPEQSAVAEEVLEWGRMISDHLTPRTTAYHELWLNGKKVDSSKPDEEPIYGKSYLPRKFKIAMAIPPRNDVDVYTQDLGFVAIEKDGKLQGFNVTVGGGMGMTHSVPETYPRLADELGFCKPDQCVAVSEAVVTVQRDFGNRVNRKNARLKYTIDREGHGLEWFRDQVQARLDFKLGKPKEATFETNGDAFGWTEGVDGNWYYCLFIEGGRVKDTEDFPMMTGLREIAKIHKGDFRLTGNQNVVIGKISKSAKPKIQKLLKEYKLEGSNFQTGLRLNSIACVALGTCTLAMAEAERYLPSLLDQLDTVMRDAGLADDPIIIRMTGCPNGCGRPYLGEIGFVGKSLGRYNMYLGASFAGDRLNKLYKENLNEEQILAELTPMIGDYAKNRKKGERFGDFVIRQGVIKATIHGMDFHS